MNKYFWLGLLSIYLFSCSGIKEQVESSSTSDFSKDEVVLKEVNRIRGDELSMKDICINRPSSFKDLVLVGYFAHDRGCAGGMMFYKGKEVDKNNDYPKILKANGWNDKAKREVIALNWVKNISLAWVIPMENEDEDFKSQDEYTFMPPTVKTEGDEIIVAIWVRQPSGKSVGANFYLQTIVFSIAEADIIRSQITDRFNVGSDQE